MSEYTHFTKLKYLIFPNGGSRNEKVEKKDGCHKHVCMKLHFFEAWPHGYTDARLVGRSAKTRNGLVFFFFWFGWLALWVLQFSTYGVMVRPSRYPVIL
jgi:hypothetical protein